MSLRPPSMIRSDGFIVQTGQREGVSLETIPLEIAVEDQKTPIYGFTLEQISRFDERTKLPFNALGTLAMSRNVDDANSADTQFFWLLKNNDMTPSGTNLLDGRFAVFGYTTENADALYNFKVGDVIESVKIVKGMENFESPAKE
uniref:peptidylprolyl isomerase n=1 Tax=Lotharella globosa TaxID=91324 RepID=A0A7S3Z424_9EUKA